jgi:hypothetical protein
MFCPNCGNGEQTPDSYCRSCGSFLPDPSKGASLISRLFGVTDPERQLKFTLTVDLVTAIVSALLIFFLMGYFDATRKRTGIPTPPVVYLVYVFLGAVAVWQLLSFTVVTTFRKKLLATKKSVAAAEETGELKGGNTQRNLPPATASDFVNNSITEQTTRRLDPVKRKRPE